MHTLHRRASFNWRFSSSNERFLSESLRLGDFDECDGDTWMTEEPRDVETFAFPFPFSLVSGTEHVLVEGLASSASS